jgi:hypothetical protein
MRRCDTSGMCSPHGGCQAAPSAKEAMDGMTKQDWEIIGLKATVAQQAKMIEHLRGGLTPAYTAADMTTAAAQGFRDGAASVAVILPPRMIDRSVDKYADGFNYAMGIAKKAIIRAGGSVKE